MALRPSSVAWVRSTAGALRNPRLSTGTSLLMRTRILAPSPAGRWPLFETPLGRMRHGRKRPTERNEVGRELSSHVSSPNLRRVTAPRMQTWVDGGKVAQDVACIAQEKAFGIAVVRCGDDLRKVNDGGAG